MASLDAPSRRGSTNGHHTPIVIPSAQLDSSLHLKAAEIATKRHYEQQQEASFNNSNYDNDPMTPPDYLLEKSLKQAEKLTAEVSVVAVQEEGVAEILDCWVQCIALSRIVHGDTHWVLAKAHIQLGRAYLELKALCQQALIHAKKGIDILLAPGCHVMSHDPPFEATCQLAVAHCVVGQVYTIQENLPKAEQELMKAKKIFSSTKLLADCGSSVQFEIDILIALAKLEFKQEKFVNSRENYSRGIGLTKTAFGPDSSKLIPLLRGQATVEAHLSLHEAALQTLQDALEIAQANHGAECEVVAEIVQSQGRLGVLQLRSGELMDLKSIEDRFNKAFSIYSSILGSKHKKSLSCKEELYLMLASQQRTQEQVVPFLKELILAKKETYGELDTEVGNSLKLLSTVLLGQGRVEEARNYLQQAKDVYCCSLGAKHKETLTVSRSLETITGCSESIKWKRSKPLEQ